MMPEVSIIIPTYRRITILRKALNSVLQQTYQDFEAIVMDDHSEDEGRTKRVVDSLGDDRFRYVYLDEKKGPAGARNAALPFCRGKYISFLDSDDLLRPQKLEKQVEILEREPDVGMVYSDEYVMSIDGRLSPEPVRVHRVPPLPSGRIARDFFSESFIGIDTVTLRKSIFIEMKGFDEKMIRNHDDDLWFRLMLKYKVVCSNYPAAIRRQHPGNISLDRTKMVYYQLQCIIKYIRIYPEFMDGNLVIVKQRLRSIMFGYVKSRLRDKMPPSARVVLAYVEILLRLRNLG
ncbi:glycosyltransferase family 2 protein [candidate division TA06 bacterium]|uniref:Glycosyltransferase family 2 protein n=1 Tax=candidate division TA06 bacterium TaxID=2250710 RepID=A0A523URH8_UNCT6|nr:MAG: glycosyltransferase family 2 protein [candidate division TA06 bacterium]